MEWFAAIEGLEPARYLRGARWSYALLNATHIFAIAMLVGSIIPLDLRLLGARKAIGQEAALRYLVPFAAVGLLLAVSTGILLFSVRATEYASLGVFQVKMVLVITGTALALVAHFRHGFALSSAGRNTLVFHGAASLFCWIAALFCGRLIAFWE